MRLLGAEREHTVEGFIVQGCFVWVDIGGHHDPRSHGRSPLRDAFQNCGPCRDFNNRHCRRVFRCLRYPRFRGSGKHQHHQANLGGYYCDVPDEVFVRNDIYCSCSFFNSLHCHRREFDMGTVNPRDSELHYRQNTRRATLEDRRRTPCDRNCSDCNHALGGRLDWDDQELKRYRKAGHFVPVDRFISQNCKEDFTTFLCILDDLTYSYFQHLLSQPGLSHVQCQNYHEDIAVLPAENHCLSNR